MHNFETMVRKLRTHTRLDEEDAAALSALPMHVKQLSPGTGIARTGNKPSHSCLIVEGVAVRSKMTDRGKRQILSIHIPGDIPDLQGLHLDVMDHDLYALFALRRRLHTA